ncbi:ankyrin repeat and KH domain-containing protein 1 isoform X4 [Amyelois transitella]|uniref:ankyrin repeat and KH domain-containing protein 1 isoform X4 n=1 Tax=Amyelois transitella TaxID=680683 RepID=UPI0029906B79|nr:ankyrin repeat and KH domain-containing protein 1 isoform X4 [Amyelois transitella]
MQNVGQSENRNIDKVNVQLDVVKSSTPQSSASSPAKSETETYSGAPAKYMSDSSESEDDSVSEAEMEEEGGGAESSKFLLSHDDPERAVDPEMQARLEALLEAAGIGKLSGEGKHLADPEVLRRLTSSVSNALDEAAAALTRMRSEQPPAHHRHQHQDKPTQCGSTATGTTPTVAASGTEGAPSLAEACSDGDVGTVRKLLTEGRSVHETTEEGESLLSLACSAGYYELAQVLLAMHASVEDRGIKGDCTPLMEAASAGHVDIVRLLLAHGADVNAVSGSGNTPLMYACAGGHEECVRALLENGANVEDHNENGHTPLMEAASAGHVGVAKILLDHGAGINTHSNEFKESALTLACYKGHLDMVRFLLAAGADREHKTDEMHTALMEASMDGHVEVARLLLDSGAQVNMPTDSFESPLTLAACGGHVELAMLLLERGANIEEVNDEGYTPLMEAAREGHEEMVALLLGQGASINAQTDETQETALTLACCGGFLEVAAFLIKAGADVELGASTPLMEASQEGHLELVRYLISAGADVHAQTQTGDTALTYACENGHTDVAELLLRAGARLEHESEGGRTPLMKAARAGHVCTVQFLRGKGADVNRMTANGDHTPLSLACAGGHVDVVKFLLACDADPFRKLKDNSTTLIEAAKGGHTAVVQLLLDYPHSVMMPRGAAGGPEAGLSAAQAAALGLAHAPRPGSPAARALLPARLPPDADLAYFKGFRDAVMQRARDHDAGRAPPAAAAVAPPSSPAGAPTYVGGDSHFIFGVVAGQHDTGSPPAAGAPGAPPAPPVKHKCPRKQRAAQHSDHHLPPPPDILHDQRVDSMGGAPRNDALPEVDRNMLELADPSGPPTLASSALHALDLQFCAQGVTTVHPPTTPPYPPPQQMFPVNQLATNLNQHLLQELEQQQLLAAQQHQKYAHGEPRPNSRSLQSQLVCEEAAGAAGVEARELSAVLAYLQREVPSLVALPPNELRSLVLQKSHEILSASCGEDTSPEGEESEERQARRLLAAAEEALTRQDHQHHHHQHYADLQQVGSNCQYRVRAASPNAVGDVTLEEEQPTLQPHFTLPPPTLPYEDYRAGTFAPAPALPQQGAPAPAPAPAPTPAPAPAPAPHYKREQREPPQHHHNNTTAAKKKVRNVRFSERGGGTAGSGPGPLGAPAAPAPAAYSAMDVDGETDSNHDTALTLACAGGHDELAELLLSRGADIEHRDKKGFTPLILAATAGHEKIVEILLNHGADIEAQSERTKDTPLSLACSGGRYEVVELILSRGANKEHRNVSDYTPLSLAASGGYVNIIRLLLHHQAEINSRTGSKLGISPLMLAAMNGHTAAVRLLLDCGSDINAQIETNRNTALTLACFQGRHEVVSLLLDRKANVEHRAKTGLTPLMEAASGGYVEVGRVLLDKGADVNAPPVPSSRDTALTIAADKGHTKFVELLLTRRAAVEVKNKKGNSPLWLAANGGHIAVVEMLYNAGADIDSQDNRKVSCLMAAFRKGHTKVVKWMVSVVTQFPSDQEMTRYICTISDKELLEKCQECVHVIRAAKETQAARANQNATILLEELDAERCREESRRQAAARRREKKKKKKMEKKEERRKLQAENDKNSMYCDKAIESETGEPDDEPQIKEEGDSGIDANSQGSCSSSDVKAPPAPSVKSKKKKKDEKTPPPPPPPPAQPAKKQPDKNKQKPETKPEKETSKPDKKQEKENVAPASPAETPARRQDKKHDKKPEEDNPKNITVQLYKYGNNSRKSQVFESTRYSLDRDDVDSTDKIKKSHSYAWEIEGKSTSPKGGCIGGRREEGWKEVVRKSSVQAVSTVEPGCKKVSVASHAISRVIGRAGTNINAIRAATGAHIEVDKQSKGQGERIITIKGSAEATKQAGALIAAMIRDPEADIASLLPRAPPAKPPPVPPPIQAKPAKHTPAKPAPAAPPAPRAPPAHRPAAAKQAAAPAARHRVPVVTATEKRAPTSQPPSSGVSGATPVKTALSYTGAVGGRSHTFAAKLGASQPADKPRTVSSMISGSSAASSSSSVSSAAPAASASPMKRDTSAATPDKLDADRPPQLSPDTTNTWNANEEVAPSTSSALHINTTPQTSSTSGAGTSSGGGAQEYSLFNDLSAGVGMWSVPEPHNVDMPPPQVDASKAPGYRGAGAVSGGGCSPCSRASSHPSTPPLQPAYHQTGNNVNTMEMSGLSRNGPIYQDNSRNGHNMMVSMSSGVNMGLGYVGVEAVSRLNPRAPDFSQRHPLLHTAQQLFTGASSAANLSTLLMSSSYQQPPPKQMQHPPQPHHYQSLVDRGWGGAGGAGGGEEEERKPRPIGTERAWKLTAGDDWPQHAPLPAAALVPDHDRYQQQPGVGVGVAAGGLEQYGGLSLLHTLQYVPAATEHHQHHRQPDKQSWSKWTH